MTESTKNPISARIWLDDQALDAARFYVDTLPAGRITGESRYPESFDNPGRKPRGSLLTVEFEVGGQRFTALNGGPDFTVNPSVSFFVHVDSPDEADGLVGKLVAGGSFLMPLDRYPWSERYAWVQDRYGVSWQVFSGAHPGGTQRIVPCLMFADAVHGRAEEAIKRYVEVFPDSRIDTIERYGASRGPEGKVVHGRFELGGQEMVAMDSHEARGATFNEALSFEISCRDQAEVDRYWRELSAGGKEGPCGWVTDRFGLSWQVVPARMSSWMTSPDVAARDRVFGALLEMRKLDVAKIERAFAGR
jgi:predicted 3-demethylubiquinone-9 3-methyltransferase (glyoxalase superfamily)